MDCFSMEAALGFYHFKINYSKLKNMGIGKWITSPKFQVGQHDWTIKCSHRDNKKNVSVFLELSRKFIDVSASFGFVLRDKHGNASRTTLKESSHTFTPFAIDWGFKHFIDTTKLEEMYIKDGCFVLLVSIGVKNESSNIPFPSFHCTQLLQHPPTLGASVPSFPCARLQNFREEDKHTDVTFDVDGMKFVAHRVILAAQSRVFEVELFGLMEESYQNCIKIKEMSPSVFKAMLDFMYIGSLYLNDELVDGCGLMSAISFLEDLLVAADRYAVESLRRMCEHKLATKISLDNVVSFLEIAEKHNCSELKKSCLRFVLDKEKSFSLVFNEEYMTLMQNHPSLLAELKEMACNEKQFIFQDRRQINIFEGII